MATEETSPRKAVLTVQNICKDYKLNNTPSSRLKTLLFGTTGHESQVALKSINFTLKKGECIGIIGSNGAGKSTLLKIITKTIYPSSGEVHVNGRLTAILELGAGFHPEFTGRQNLYFSGSIIGISNEKMKELEAEIIEFSELSDAIDRPVKTYSSGMTVRLAFSLITALRPDILIIDEALAVGDQHFQKKCIDRIQTYKEAGSSILFCSHSNYHILQLCDKALWLDHGEQIMYGESQEVVAAYEQKIRSLEKQNTKTIKAAPYSKGEQHLTDEIINSKIIECAVQNISKGSHMPTLQSQDLKINIKVHTTDNQKPSIGLMIEQYQGIGITSVGSHKDNFQLNNPSPGIWTAKLTFPKLPLNTGEYVISLYLFDESGLVIYDEWLNHQRFKFINPESTPGLIQIPHTWK